MLFKKNFLLSLIEISVYFFPVSLIAGSLVVNLNIIIFILLGLTYFIINRIKVHLNFSNISLLLFFFVLITSSFLNKDLIGISNFLKSILLLKFFLLYIFIETLIYNKKINLNFFFKICLSVITLLAIDLVIQFLFGKNILGYEPWEGRITGIFEHEAIAGSYLQKIFIFSLSGALLIFFPNKGKNFWFFTLILIIIIFGSFVASNRISFLILFSLFIFLIVFYKIFRKNLFLSIVAVLPIFFYYYHTDVQTNIKYKGFINKIVQFSNLNKSTINETQPNIENTPKKNILNNHAKIYLTTYKSFKDSVLLGHGLKSFRYNCNSFLKEQNTLCSTHPHNYHLEVLHDTGIIGFILISLFAFSLVGKTFFRIKSENLTNLEKIIISLILLNFLIELFPLKSTGSFFTTWNGTLLWISIAFVNFKNENDIRKSKK